MLYQHSFQRKISLLPRELNNVCNNIRKQISQLVGTCSENVGYIVHIQHIHFDSMTNQISRVNGSVEFTVSFDATCMIPKMNECILAQIQIVFQEGILLEYKQMKLIIPFEHIRSPATKIGDMIWVKITSIRYGKGEYQCIGEETKKEI